MDEEEEVKPTTDEVSVGGEEEGFSTLLELIDCRLDGSIGGSLVEESKVGRFALVDDEMAIRLDVGTPQSEENLDNEPKGGKEGLAKVGEVEKERVGKIANVGAVLDDKPTAEEGEVGFITWEDDRAGPGNGGIVRVVQLIVCVACMLDGSRGHGRFDGTSGGKIDKPSVVSVKEVEDIGG
jgi:hypothetical protein